MKKKISYIIILFLFTTLYSLDFKTVVNSKLYETDGIYNYYSGEIKKNEIVKISKAQIYYGVSDWKYSVSVIYKNKEYLMNIEDLTPEETQITFEDEILLLQNDEYRWLPVFGYDMLNNQNRDLLCKKQPKGFDKYQKQKTEFDYEWYDTLSNTIPSYFFNSLFSISLYFNNCSFLIKCIKKYNGYYLIEAQVYDWFMPDSKYDFTKLDNVTLKLSKDGDYLNLFCNDLLLGQFAKSNKETRQEIEALLKNNSCDISKVTWPRHADGSCDYDGSKKTVASQAQKAASSTNVAPNKTMTVRENLKLRSGEDTSSQVLAVMQAGAKVRILELGKAETIDGIASNWVKVEVQQGAKDRDGKAVKKGTVGWCFGGYLE